MEERRFHPRLELPLQAEILLQGTKRQATVENLSAGGAALRLTEEIAEGTELEEISFTLPGRDELDECEVTTKATVIRVEPLPQSHGEGGHRAAIRFLGLSEEHHQRIQQFIFRSLTKGRPSTTEMPLDRRRVAVGQPVSIRFGRFDEFVEEMSENISVGGMFIRTKTPRPPGSVFSFQFQLGDDFSLIEGRAEVVWTRNKSLNQTQQAGMGIRFLELDEGSRNVILNLVQKESGGDGADETKKVSFNVASVVPTMLPTAAPQELELVDLEVSDETFEGASSQSAGSQAEDLRSELARRTKAHENRIGELEERIAKLTATHVDDESHLLESKSSAAELQSLNELLEEQLEEARTRVEHESRDLHDKLEAANRDLEELREELQERESEATASRSKAGGFENRLLAVEQALRHSEREREDLSSRLKDSTQQRQEFEEAIEVLKSGDRSAEHEARQEEFLLQAEEMANREAVLADRLSVAEEERDEALAKLENAQDSAQKLTEEAERERHDSRSALSDVQDELARVQRDREIEVTELSREVEAGQGLGAEAQRVREELEGVQRDRDSLKENLEEEVSQARRTGAELEEQVLQLEATLENSVRSRHEVEESLRQLEDELNQAQDEHQELESGLRQEAMKAVAAADGAKDSIKHLETSLAEADRARSELHADLEASRHETECLQAESQEVSARVTSLEVSLEESETSQQDLINQIESLKNRSRKAEESLTGARNEIDQLRSESEAQVGDLESQLVETGRAKEAHREKILDLETMLLSAEKEATERTEAERLAREALEELQSESDARISDLEGRLAEAEQAGGALQEKVVDLDGLLELAETEAAERAEGEKSIREALEQLQSESETRIGGLEGQLAEAERTTEADRERVSGLESLLAQAEEGATERTEAERSTREALEQLQMESGTRISDLETQLTETEQARDTLAEKMANLEGALAQAEEDAKEQGDRWREAEERLGGRLEEEKGEARSLKSELKSLVATGQSTEQKLEKMRTVIGNLETDLEKALVDLRDQESRAGESETKLRQELEEAAGVERALKEKLTEFEDSSQRDREQHESLASELKEAVTEREALREQVVTLQAAVKGFAAELEEQGRPVDLKAALAGSAPAESHSKGRWMRAVGLVAAGLLGGAVLVGPVAKFLPSGLSPSSESAGEGAVVSAVDRPPPAEEVASVAVEGEVTQEPESEGDVLGDTDAGVDTSPGESDEPIESPEPSYPAVGEVVQAWADAWSGQRVEDYLWFYARGFAPPNGASRSAWEAYRRERLEAPSSIQVTLEKLSEQSLDDNRTSVTFEQAYRAGSYGDRVLKTLVMVREDGSWKILSEQSEPL